MSSDKLNFNIREDVKKIDDMTEEEIENNAVVSEGFWYDIDGGDGDMFISLLEDEETKKACREAIQTLSKLERAVEDYVEWC